MIENKFSEDSDFESSPDPIDQASNYEMRFTEHSLQKQLEENRPPREYEEGEDYFCIDCGCDIPVKRAKHGYALCVDCQTFADKFNKIKKIRGES